MLYVLKKPIRNSALSKSSQHFVFRHFVISISCPSKLCLIKRFIHFHFAILTLCPFKVRSFLSFHFWRSVVTLPPFDVKVILCPFCHKYFRYVDLLSISSCTLLRLSASPGCSVLALLACSLPQTSFGLPVACRGGAREPALLAWEVASCILDSVRPLARIEVVCSARGGSSSHLLQGAGHRQGFSKIPSLCKISKT